MVKIIANQSLPYGKRRYAAGDEVEVSDKDARLLVGINRARLAPGPVEAPVSIRSMAAPDAVEPEPAPEPEQAPAEPKEEAAPEAPAHPQTYSRRDMQAAGPTGQDVRSPSSRRVHPSKRPKSTS